MVSLLLDVSFGLYETIAYIIRSAHVLAVLTSVNVSVALEITLANMSKGSMHALRPEGCGFKPRNTSSGK